MSEKRIENLFNEASLYTKEIFEVFEFRNNMYELNQESLLDFLKYIGYSQEKLITYCHKCKKEFPFYIIREIMNGYITSREYITIVEDKKSFVGKINICNGYIEGLQPPYNKEIFENNRICYIEYYLTCANNENHKYLMIISVEIKDGKFIVRKIGQNPSILTIRGFDFDIYKTFLNKINGYEDYKKAELCNTEHFFVGAYAYLRRVFEKMIKFYLEDIKLKDNHMDTKIEAVKEKFDPRVKDLLKNLYEILSISIHELEEEQSREYYTYLKATIDMQLEYIKTEEDKDNQSKRLQSTLSKISNLLKK